LLNFTGFPFDDHALAAKEAYLTRTQTLTELNLSEKIPFAVLGMH
jgi:hypothetical protein